MSRPRWWFWTIYALTVLLMFIVGVAFGLLASVNPYIAGAVMAGTAVLRITYQIARGNLYVRWWDHS